METRIFKRYLNRVNGQPYFLYYAQYKRRVFLLFYKWTTLNAFTTESEAKSCIDCHLKSKDSIIEYPEGRGWDPGY